MNLNKQQTQLWSVVNMMLETLKNLDLSSEQIKKGMAAHIAEFEAKVSGARVRLDFEGEPRLSLIDCSRDSLRTTTDNSGTTMLRGRILNTRLTAQVALREDKVCNEIIVLALRKMADYIEQLSVELGSEESMDVFEVLGLGKNPTLQEDDMVIGDQGADQDDTQRLDGEEEAAPANQAEDSAFQDDVAPSDTKAAEVTSKSDDLPTSAQPEQKSDEPCAELISMTDEESRQFA